MMMNENQNLSINDKRRDKIKENLIKVLIYLLNAVKQAKRKRSRGEIENWKSGLLN